MAKKYEFTGETKAWLGHTLHRIRALSSFEGVKAGDLGGWIEKEENLSQGGSAWVYGSAVVGASAVVDDSAVVYGEAVVCGSAVVCDSARVYDSARVCDEAVVCGSARVCDSAVVYDEARVYGSAWVYGSAVVWRTNHYFCIGPMGSRLDFTTFFRSKDKQIYVRCGCFHGDIDAFALKVQADHGNNQHAKAYMAAIELAKMQIDLSGDDPEVEEAADE